MRDIGKNARWWGYQRGIVGVGTAIMALMLSGCSGKEPGSPSGDTWGVRRVDYQGEIDLLTEAHAEHAWGILMGRLAAQGMPGADSSDNRGGRLAMHEGWAPDREEIPRPWLFWNAGVVVWGFTDVGKREIHIPGTFTMAPDPEAILRHEFLHHWCWQTMHQTCGEPYEGGWKMPNGVDIWVVAK